MKNLRKIRHKRIRRKLKGTADKPRLCVYRSSKHIYTQIINDVLGVTLASASTLSKEFKDLNFKSSTKQAAVWVGESIAKKAQALGITFICYDRSGYRYHGKVKAIADAARKGGLNF